MTLVLLNDDNDTGAGGAAVVTRVPEGRAGREQVLRDLIFAHPEILPLAELEPEIGQVLPVAIEVNLPGAGFIDVLLVSEHGRLIVVECKLWRNPQARREVVGQVLDYARELARYGYEDLQRVVSARTGRRGNVLHDLAAAAGSMLGEAQFVDRVSRDLAAGRFLLVIAGDGITEGAQRIGEYLSAQAGLAFDLAMVEIAEYRFTDPLTSTERRIVQPRLLARTATIDRFVIRSDIPGIVVESEVDGGDSSPSGRASRSPSGPSASQVTWRAFVDAFVNEVSFDDPAQMPPRYGGNNWMRLPLPGPAYVTLYRSAPGANMGAFLRFSDAEGRAVHDSLIEQQDAIAAEFIAAGLPAPEWSEDSGRPMLAITAPAPLPWDANAEAAQRQWLARAANQFVNSLRPRLVRLDQ